LHLFHSRNSCGCRKLPQEKIALPATFS
jgi:hypothetical protein